MKKTRIGINGFGRIGRCVLRVLSQNPQFDVVLINDLTDAATLAHLYRYDSVHGTLQQEVRGEGNTIFLNKRPIKVSAIKNPADIPWGAENVDIVLECTGLFTEGEKAQAHLQAGAKKVIISAPAKKIHKTLVCGVNLEEYNPATHHLISNGSCTTNCLAPVVKVLEEKFGIQKGLMTTVHSYTNDQNILDLPHKDLRRARAAALSMIPTTTGAAQAIAEVIPSLAGKLHGMAVRVPTPNVSLVDVTLELTASHVQAEQVNEAFRQAAQGSLRGILGVSEEPLVSIDFNGSPLSATVDMACTTVIGGNMVKVLAWYDNEWGFSNRMVDLTAHVANRLS